MKEDTFSKDYVQFKDKVHSFTLETHFYTRLQQYQDLLDDIKSLSPDKLNETLQNSCEFLDARNESIVLMEKIVELHKGLDTIFTMDEETLGNLCQYNLGMIEQRVADELNVGADLLHQFELVSEKERKIIEILEDPFLSQGM